MNEKVEVKISENISLTLKVKGAGLKHVLKELVRSGGWYSEDAFADDFHGKSNKPSYEEVQKLKKVFSVLEDELDVEFSDDEEDGE